MWDEVFDDRSAEAAPTSERASSADPPAAEPIPPVLATEDPATVAYTPPVAEPAPPVPDTEDPVAVAVTAPGGSAEFRAARSRVMEREMELRRVMERLAAARNKNGDGQGGNGPDGGSTL